MSDLRVYKTHSNSPILQLLHNNLVIVREDRVVNYVDLVTGDREMAGWRVIGLQRSDVSDIVFFSRCNVPYLVVHKVFRLCQRGRGAAGDVSGDFLRLDRQNAGTSAYYGSVCVDIWECKKH